MSNRFNSLDHWLSFCECLHNTEMDFETTRLKVVFERMAISFSGTVFTVAGTNGKGSTCAMLEAILLQSGFTTGVYSSPHLVRFNERLRLNGIDASDEDLMASFEVVEAARTKGQTIPLTFFEFTTLVFLDVMARRKVDAVILEVGLGGRLDAVNIVDTDCAIITSIDLDHMALLGHDRESIGLEKAGIMRAAKPAIVSDPSPPNSVVQYAQRMGADLWLNGVDFHVEGSELQWGWFASEERGARRYTGLAYPALRGANQLINAAGVLAALTSVRDQLPVTAQAVRVGFASVALLGRFQIIPGTPVVVLDVAHNPHAAAVLANNLDAMGFYPKTHVVLGMMADKDVQGVMQKIAPLVDSWYFTDLPTPRAAKSEDLKNSWQQAFFKTRPECAIGMYGSPQKALEAALANASQQDRIVICGSFYTVGEILQIGIEHFRQPLKT